MSPSFTKRLSFFLLEIPSFWGLIYVITSQIAPEEKFAGPTVGSLFTILAVTISRRITLRSFLKHLEIDRTLIVFIPLTLFAVYSGSKPRYGEFFSMMGFYFFAYSIINIANRPKK